MKKGISTKAPRICRRCGVVFDGGPRAWYCPKCREVRMKLYKDRAKENRKRGKNITLGESIGKCEACGKELVYASARQRYCPYCAKEAWKASDRRQGREYYHANNTEENRAERSRHRREVYASRQRKTCKVCGKEIPLGSYRKNYCSEECAKISQRYQEMESKLRAGKRKSIPSWEEWIEQHGTVHAVPLLLSTTCLQNTMIRPLYCYFVFV